MQIPTSNAPKPLRQAPDLTGVDIDALPVWPKDPLSDFYETRAMGTWTMGRAKPTVGLGYWSGLHKIPDMIVLLRRNELWMSITPMETESQILGVEASKGHVVIFGLGLGWAAAKSALKPEVEKVTVVERDPNVLAMHEQLKLFDRLPDNAGEKVHLVQDDALSWRAREPVDLLIPDIWLEMVSMNRGASVYDMQRRVKADKIYFWTQELELARYAAFAGRYLDDAGVVESIEETGLPLVGLDVPNYAERIRKAALQWIKGRWLPDTKVPDYLRTEADDYIEAQRAKRDGA